MDKFRYCFALLLLSSISPSPLRAEPTPIIHTFSVDAEGKLVDVPAWKDLEIKVDPAVFFTPPEDQPWGQEIEGVNCRLRRDAHAIERNDPFGFQIDLRSARPRLLPHYGPPADAFDVRLDGVWYVRSKRGKDAEIFRSADPSEANVRENLWFYLQPLEWCRADNRSIMTSLSKGKHRLEIAFPFQPDPSTTKTLRAVSNPIEFTVPDFEMPASDRKGELTQWFHRLTHEPRLPTERGITQTIYFHGLPRDDLKWSDIPIFLELAKSSELVRNGLLSSPLSSYACQSEGRAGMVALFIVEVLRRIEKKDPYAGPLDSFCQKESLPYRDCEASEEIHQQALQAYQAWWARVQSLPPQEAAKINPLAGTDIHWPGAY